MLKLSDVPYISSYTETLRLITIAVLVRCGLVFLGLGDYFAWRIEPSTPANALLTVREGIVLARLGISPYQGSSCHVPPALLWLASPFALSDVAYVIIGTLADVVAGLSLRATLQKLLALHRPLFAETLLSPDQLLCAYLFNPLAIISCISGSLSPIENLCISAAIHAACIGNLPLSSFSLACATYIGVHPILLMVSIVLLLARGPENVFVMGPKDVLSTGTSQTDECCQDPSAMQTPAGAAFGSQQPAASQAPAAEGCQQPSGSAASSRPELATNSSTAGMVSRSTNTTQARGNGSSFSATARLAVVFLAWFMFWCTCLIAVSDLAVRKFPQEQCLPRVLSLGMNALWHLSNHKQQQTSGPTVQDTSLSSSGGSSAIGCWLTQAYRLHILIENLTPNIGQFWYFFTEIFAAYRAMFCFLAHALAALFALPMAVRFPNRPLAIAVCQLVIISLLKPYPSVGDLALYMSLLALLPAQMQCLRHGLLLVNSFGLLMVLGPSMWHQWINAESANSNFFYSISLLLGAWQVLLLVQLLLLTKEVEEHVKGKLAATCAASKVVFPKASK